MAVEVVARAIFPVREVDPRTLETYFADDAPGPLSPLGLPGREGIALSYLISATPFDLPITLAAYTSENPPASFGVPDLSKRVIELFYSDPVGSGLQIAVEFTAGEGPTLQQIIDGYNVDDLMAVATSLNGRNLDGTSPGPTSGDDSLDFGDGPDLIVALAGNDTITAGNGNDTIYGGPGDDSIRGEAGFDFIGGGTGNDILRGEGQNDTMYGGAGDDTLYGGNDNDLLGGGEGNDLLFGDTDDDQLYGANGNDTLNGGNDDDTLGGGAGDDSLNGGDKDDQLWGSLGNDTLIGENGNDLLGGAAGADSMNGGQGNDTIWGGADNDTIDGGGGDDFIGAGSGDDTILTFLSGRMEVYGGLGNDLLSVANGDDTLAGGAGNDTMTGGQGADVFVFYTRLGADQDTVTDFQVGTDKLQVFGVTGFDAAAKFAALTITQSGTSDTLVEANGHNILLQNVVTSSLTVDDFLF